MLVSKAVLVTNHPELGVRAQPMLCPPNLNGVAIQFGLMSNTEPRVGQLRWYLHEDLLFINKLEPDAEPYHFIGCHDHHPTFRGQTFVFFCPSRKQHEASAPTIKGSWAHIAADFETRDSALVQTLFFPGEGSSRLAAVETELRNSHVASPESPPRRERARGTGEKFGEGDKLTQVFDMLSAAGYNVDLIQLDENVIGVRAAVEPPPLSERTLAEDPGFIQDLPPLPHSIGLTILSEVAFDPIHFPTFSAYVIAAATGYCRMLSLNVEQDVLEPEVGKVLLDDCVEIVSKATAMRQAEPSLIWLETPMLAKLPCEPGGRGESAKPGKPAKPVKSSK